MILFAIGLMAAGLTSAITAPIAAGFAASGCFGWPPRLADWRLRVVATVVVCAGATVAWFSTKSPAETIIAAQIANGLLLPIVAIFLLISLNRKKLMGAFSNGILANVLAAIVILVTLALAARQFDSAWGKIEKLLTEYGWL